jgi:sulfite reductase beta subunit-like hemoprotein
VEPDEIVELCGAIASVFRDEGNRENRKKARLKFLVEQWEIPRFRDEVEKQLGYKLRPTTDVDAPLAESDRSHVGIQPQREPGQFYAGLSMIGGRTSGSALRQLALLARELGSGRIRTTNTQNIILLDIPQSNVAELRRRLETTGFDLNPGWSRKGIIACTGIQFCKLALAETKNRAVDLATNLEATVQLEQAVRISVTGCPNSCGQHHICDVGLEGSITTIDGVKRETFQVFLGGGVGEHETFGRRIGVRVPAEELSESLAALFTRYKEDRIPSETFQGFCLRHSSEKLAGFMTLPGSHLRGIGVSESRIRRSAEVAKQAGD